MIKFKEITKTRFVDIDGILKTWVYEVYTGDTKEEAINFLKRKIVEDRFHYIIVETPEGNYGKDILGFYREGDNIFLDLEI